MQEAIDMWGGETRTDRVWMDAGSVFYHQSATKLEKFHDFGVPESTCFFVDMRGNKTDYCYRVTLLSGRYVGCYGAEEVRFNPALGKVLVEYVGKNYSKLDSPTTIPVVEI